MNARPTRLATVFAAAVLAVATIGVVPAAADAPPPPQNDAFYQPPGGYESTAPGTVLRSRPVTLAAFSALPWKVQAWQLLYRTTDTQDQPEATVTTVVLPAGASPSAQRPLLSYETAEDSTAPQCANSYQLRQGAGNENINSQAEILLIDAAVRKGWAVAIPDYEGPKSAYAAGKQAGQASLDGIRAAEHFTPLGLDGAQTSVGIWGYSGGALAAGWTAELHGSYAPELNIKGTAAGGYPADPGAALTGANGGPFSGVVVTGLSGVSQAYPELQQFFDAHLTAEGKAMIAKARTQCFVPNVLEYAFKDINNYFDIPNPLSDPVAKKVLAEDTMGQHTPKAPMFIYHAIHDELVPIAPTEKTVAAYCAGGATVQFQRDGLSEHVILAATGAADALNWLSDRIGGTPPTPGCQTKTVITSLASPGALQTFGTLIYGDLLSLAGRPVGPTDES